MTNYQFAVQTIKDSVSALDVGRAVGLNVDQHGRCSCPFHNGRDRNMKLFAGNRGFSCFVCHESGDCIKLAQNCLGMPFKDTLTWINDTFHLSLDLDSRVAPSEQKQAETALKLRKDACELEERIDRMKFDLALMADDLLMRLERIRDRNKPETIGEQWNDQFCKAVAMLPGAERFVKDCWYDCVKEKKE